jgi:hypothetical protein
MKKKTKRLGLNRDTLRALAVDELGHVIGASGGHQMGNGPHSANRHCSGHAAE